MTLAAPSREDPAPPNPGRQSYKWLLIMVVAAIVAGWVAVFLD